MKFKSLMLLTGIICLSSCGSLDDITMTGLFDDQDAVGRDALFSDSTFKHIPTHDSIDCAGSCTVKLYNK
jgi:hypothetical protein